MQSIQPQFDPTSPPAVYGEEGEPVPRAAEEWPSRVDVAVIGGGITGLSAAYHLAGKARVAVLEARQIGHGASGRAFGQIVPYLKHGSERLIALYGKERGERIIAAVGDGPDTVFGLIEKHRIACLPVRTGLLIAARNRSGLLRLEHLAADWQRRGVPVRTLGADETGEKVGSGLYGGSLLDPRGGHLNPLAFTRGLARAAAEQGALLHPGMPVTELSREQGNWLVRCAERSMLADAVIIATNAYTSGLWPALSMTIVPIRVHGAVTAPLPADLLARILPEGQPLTDTRRLYSGVRKIGARLHVTANGSLFGSGSARIEAGCARLTELFPWLPAPAFIERWSGWIALTPDQLPHVHALAPGLWAGIGYNGRGLVAAVLVGRDLARGVLGCPESELTFPVSRLTPLPSPALARLAVAGTVAAYRMLDRIDSLVALRG